MPLFLVGGAVRNTLLMRPIQDYDFATPARPERIQKLLDTQFKIKTHGISHGTVTAIAERTFFHITTFRQDLKSHGRYATVAFDVDMTTDSQRRDFTLNALYADAQGRVHVPIPGSLQDVHQRIIRFIGSPEQRLKEDGLRLLRFYRFHTLYGQSKNDLDIIEGCFARNIKMVIQLSKERIVQELQIILTHHRWHQAFQSLHRIGLIDRLFPSARYQAIKNVDPGMNVPWHTWLWLLDMRQWPMTRQQHHMLKKQMNAPGITTCT